MKKAITYLIAIAMVIGATACSTTSKDTAVATKPVANNKASSTAAAADVAYDSTRALPGGGGVVGYTAKATEAADIKTDSKMVQAPGAMPIGGTQPGQPQKLVYYIDYNVETIEFDNAIGKIEEIVEKYSGLVENSSFASGGSYYKAEINSSVGLRSANYTLRISTDKLDAFEQEFKGIGNVLNRSKSTQDMSKQYYDTQSRIDALKVQQKRLLELLEKAKDMADIITIEQRLSDVNYQLDSFTAENKYIDNLVNFSTVTINLREVLKEQVIDNAPKNIFEEIGQTFKKSLRDVGNSIRDFVVIFIGNLPEIITTLIVWGILLFAGIKIYNMAVKKYISKKLKSKPVNETPENPDDK